MNLHHLKVFHAVAHTENFSHAADRLFISQPAVSVQVRRLEEALGLPLVEVYGRRVHLTEAGTRLMEFADQILRLEADAEEAMAEYLDPSRGRIRVGASTTPGTYLLPGVVAGFQRQNPGVQVALELANTRSIEAKLLANELDLGIVGEDLSGDAGLVLEPWLVDRMLLIAPPGHELASGPVPPERLRGERFVLREPGSSTREFFTAQAETLGLEISQGLQLANTEAVREAVAAGLGLAVVSELAVLTDLQVGRLVALNVTGLRLERRFHLAWHRSKRLSRTGAAFLRFVQEYRPAERA